jgi:hypothetical protein
MGRMVTAGTRKIRGGGKEGGALAIEGNDGVWKKSKEGVG